MDLMDKLQYLVELLTMVSRAAQERVMAAMDSIGEMETDLFLDIDETMIM